ncbi:hypothetical protein K490DRAFT_67418 [Saccharata proteae CBS 121410]|uniref:Uncharacterized protein n=1 Tax=Saccharata proteae CBS 121410 TaxID=1314787 RepID=A0A9P4HV46_9PEZI|nr:hypothetical protein K490DRAFT_67418 [Saccharata proteae CBS 121410]
MTSLFQQVNAEVERELKTRIQDIATTVWPNAENVKVLTSKKDSGLYGLVVAKAGSGKASTAESTSSISVLIHGDAAYTTTEDALVALNEHVASKLEEFLSFENHAPTALTAIPDHGESDKFEETHCSAVEDEDTGEGEKASECEESPKGQKTQYNDEITEASKLPALVELEEYLIDPYEDDLVGIPGTPGKVTWNLSEMPAVVDLDEHFAGLYGDDLLGIPLIPTETGPVLPDEDLIDVDALGWHAWLWMDPDKYEEFMDDTYGWIDSTRLPESEVIDRRPDIPEFYTPDEAEDQLPIIGHLYHSEYIHEMSMGPWDSITRLDYLPPSENEVDDCEEEPKEACSGYF